MGRPRSAQRGMKVKVLGCYGGIAPGQGMTSFLINDTVALDAGGLSYALSVDKQALVKDVFISHAHQNARIAIALTDCLVSGAGLSYREILCTSHPRQEARLQTGEDINDKLKKCSKHK